MGVINTGADAKQRSSLATRCGVCALALAAALFPFSTGLALLPLGGFVLVCMLAPFLPSVGFYLPVISRGTSSHNAVALTFDDGPDPESTPGILALLEKHAVQATFFVNGQRVLRYPEMITAILSQGHAIGNHSHSHDNFIMCKSSTALRQEIQDTQRVLIEMGIKPLAFRPPVGITNPKLEKVLTQLGMYALNFNRRAADFGNRRIKHLSQRILNKAAANDIIMLHDIKPHGAARADHWLQELDNILGGLKAKGLAVLPLEELIGRPVMERVGEKSRQPI